MEDDVLIFKNQAIDLCEKYSDRIEVDLFKRYLHISTLKSNKLLELLEDEGIISNLDENYERHLINKKQ